MILEKNVTHWLLTFSTLISISILGIFSLLVQKKMMINKRNLSTYKDMLKSENRGK